MRRRRLIHQSDRVQAPIVAGLRKAGYSVEIIGEPVDLIVADDAKNVFMEVKNDHKAKLRPSQVEFFASWRGPKAVVTTLEEALVVMGWAQP